MTETLIVGRFIILAVALIGAIYYGYRSLRSLGAILDYITADYIGSTYWVDLLVDFGVKLLKCLVCIIVCKLLD